MAEIKYTKAQMEELRANKYVKSLTQKYITFTDEFKIRAIELDKRYFLPREIFKEFWFPNYIINSEIPSESLKRWRRLSKSEKLVWRKKWRPKKEKIDFENMTKDEKIEYLETENAYLKELYKYKHWKYP